MPDAPTAEADPAAAEYVSFELLSTVVSTAEQPSGRLRFVHNASHIGRPYRLQQEWIVTECRREKTGDIHMTSGSREWRDVPCAEEGAIERGEHEESGDGR